MATHARWRSAMRTVSWLLLIIYSGCIFYTSSSPLPSIAESRFSGMDKLLHVGAFLVWGALCAWSLRSSFPRLAPRRAIAIAAVAGALYGLSDELHQSFVPHRLADGWDFLADVIGAVAGAALGTALWGRSSARTTARPSE